ncbi:hypothetical protein Lal_00004089 [Lupinus albus]|nr:hypothetical protein Lal_00004089 [Lupinus albus]
MMQPHIEMQPYIDGSDAKSGAEDAGSDAKASFDALLLSTFFDSLLFFFISAASSSFSILSKTWLMLWLSSITLVTH